MKYLVAAYPRGGKFLKKLFPTFSTLGTKLWFDQRGVPLITEDDGRVFPSSHQSQSIIDCFFDACDRLG